MKASLALALLCLTSCSIVTAPVEAVGDVASTTVRTAGDVVQAPFKTLRGPKTEVHNHYHD